MEEEQPDYVSYGNEVTNKLDGAKILRYFQTITTSEPQIDNKGEEYLDLSRCGSINDQNQVRDLYSRRDLWNNDGPHPELRGRQVIFDFARPLFDEVKSAFQSGVEVVLITGTPGIGKSSLRNVHAHFLLNAAHKKRARCCLLFSKSGEDTMIRLHLEANGSYHVELVPISCHWIYLGFPDFTPGDDLFILADISGGDIQNLKGPGLIMYSSPNQVLADKQIMKANSVTLGYPLLTKDQLCRYTNERMNLMFERYGGLARLVWGGEFDEDAHRARLQNKLNDVNGFLDLLEHKDYLQGPLQYFYTKLQEDANGNPRYNLNKYPPTVVPAPRFVIKMVAKSVVARLLMPSLQADFCKLHKAVDGILFEEVCLHLIEHHPKDIAFRMKNLSNRKRPFHGHLKGNILKLQDFERIERKDVDSADFVTALDGSETPYLVVPKVSNFPGVDAVLALGAIKRRNGIETPEVALDLQMTRSLQHKVSDEGVNISNKIDSRLSSDNKPATKHCLLFLVPEYNFDSFQKQSAENDAKQKELDKFTQFVGCIKLAR